MKKLIVIFLSFSLLFQSFIPGFIGSVRIAQAASLSTSIFPSSLGGMSKVQTSTRIDSTCFVNVKEFVAAAYSNSARTKVLGVSVSRYDSSSKAESIARNCIVIVKAQFGSAISWQATKNTTVSGYKSFFVKGGAPAEGAYIGILYTIVREYLIASVILGESSVSESSLKSIDTVMIGKIPKTAKRRDGESCKTATECSSGHCYNGYCCQSGKSAAGQAEIVHLAGVATPANTIVLRKKVTGRPVSKGRIVSPATAELIKVLVSVVIRVI